MRKLDMLGTDYFDMLMLEERRKSDYKIYITDVLKIIAERVCGISGLNADIQRYRDFIHGTPKPAEKSPEEKLNDIVSAAGLTLIT